MKSMALNSQIRKKELSQINNLCFISKEPGKKKEQNKLKASRRKEIISLRAEIDDIFIKIIGNAKKTKSWLKIFMKLMNLWQDCQRKKISISRIKQDISLLYSIYILMYI